jgi:hypothetical protein
MVRRSFFGKSGAFVSVIQLKKGQGKIPLVIDVANADTMATVIQLKQEVERRTGERMRIVFAGASEAHILASQIGDDGPLLHRADCSHECSAIQQPRISV